MLSAGRCARKTYKRFPIFLKYRRIFSLVHVLFDRCGGIGDTGGLHISMVKIEDVLCRGFHLYMVLLNFAATLIPIIKFFPFDTFLYNRSNTFGALVGPEKYSGSSMLQYHPHWFPSSYEIYDENFRDACCGAADLCQVFYSRRPPDDCSRYRPPRWSKKSYS